MEKEKEVFEDNKGKYTIIEKSHWWQHGCHPETCGCGSPMELITLRYKQYEDGELVRI